MHVVDVFCERCGTPQPKPDVSAGRSPGFLARRVLDAVGITESETTGAEDWLRLCLNCRGYSCPTCWNDSAGVCQTCEPLPEPIVELVPQPAPLPVVAGLPRYIAPQMPEPVLYSPAPEPVLYSPAPEPVLYSPAPEPAVVAEPEPESDPIERPAPPRMPVLPLPPPRPANAPPIPLPPLHPYPVAPQITFNPSLSVGVSAQTSAPAFEAHLLLAPPPELPPNAIAAGLRPCPSCRVTLSARAHFCRRCGSAQAH
jgi:hypothetical protein